MKRIALVLCATASLFSGVSAMDVLQREQVSVQLDDKTMRRLELCKNVSVFCVNTTPPVTVDQLFSCVAVESCSYDKKSYCFSYKFKPTGIAIHIGEDGPIGKTISLKERYGDIELKSPLELNYEMKRTQIVKALFSAFGSDKEITTYTFRKAIDDEAFPEMCGDKFTISSNQH